MSFQPVVPLSGYTGWRFLQQTLTSQQTAFTQSAPVVRAADYFRENITQITNAEDLVNDRRLLEVALGAFGLDEDIDNKFFIQKILEDGTTDDEALANRLSDTRYAEFSETFGFGDFDTPLSTISVIADKIVSKFETQSFESAVGDQNNDLRLALNFASSLEDVISGSTTKDAQWFSLMGDAPLREVVQTALGLPSEIASVDIDQQLKVFQSRAESVFGSDSLSDLTDADSQEKMIRLFLIRSEAAAFSGASGSSIALTLLQSGN